MSFINDQESKIPRLLKQAKVSSFAYFIYIIAIATVGAGYCVRRISPNIDWSDWGAILIMSAAAGACYTAIWSYVKRITSNLDK